MSAGPLYRLDPAIRARRLRDFEGEVVVVTYSALRGATEAVTVVGRVLGVARPITGAQTDALILWVGQGEDLLALSAATIVDVEVAERQEARA